MTEETKPAFNLLDEPWIPVRAHTGGVRDVSLADALLNARDYAALAETSPPNLIAIYRLLLAVLHRALTTQHGPWKDADRARWFREGLPQAAILAYLEQWRERFWLFHPTHPFMQAAILATLPDTSVMKFPCSILALDQFYGPEMFDHGVYDQGPRDTLRVIRGVLGYLQFVPYGFFPGKKLKSSEKAGPLYSSAAVLVLGGNLEETLLINMHPFEAQHLDDLPHWEKEELTAERLRATPTLATGPIDRYTRLTRSLLLLPSRSPELLHELHFAAGVSFADDPNAPDPMVAYRYSTNGDPIRISFEDGRSIWRDLPSLLPDPVGNTAKPPAVLEYARNLYDALGLFDVELSVLVAGIACDQAKMLRWRVETLALPQALLSTPDYAATLRDQIKLADAMYTTGRKFMAGMIAETLPDPKHKDTRAKSREMFDKGPASAVFFTTAERALPLLIKQIAIGDIETAARDWANALVVAAKESWEATRRSLGDSPAVLRADAKTWPRFSGWLKTMASTATESNPEEAKP